MEKVYYILFAAILLFYLAVNGSVKKRYREEMKPLDAGEYSLKGLLPFGLWMFDEINFPTGGNYHVFLYQRVVMVYGSRYAQYYLKVHWAEKFFYLFAGLIIASFFGAISDLGFGYIPVIPVSGILLFFLADKNLDDRAKKRKIQLMMDFPVFISKLTLLMNAGMHLRQALERIVADSGKQTPLYVELGTVLEDFASGLGESQAWQEFSERCRVKEITSFSNMIMQNSKIGGNRLVDELKRMTHETWNIRKHAAKQMGETASAKLIFPLMLMFLAILIIVVAPAIMQFSHGF